MAQNSRASLDLKGTRQMGITPVLVKISVDKWLKDSCFFPASAFFHPYKLPSQCDTEPKEVVWLQGRYPNSLGG